MKSQLVIVAGMHRSTTSLLAQYLSKCGMYLGENLLGPKPDNQDGYFENSIAVKVQGGLLKRRYFNLFLTGRVKAFPNGAKHSLRNEISNLKQKQVPVIGLKDPRNTLFLEAWKELEPNSKFILIYRNYSEVIGSLLRRSSDKILRIFPNLSAIGWLNYNNAIIDFYEDNRDRCVLISNNDLISEDKAMVEKINKVLNLKLKYTPISEIYKPHLTQRNKEPNARTKRIISKYYKKLEHTSEKLIMLSKESNSR